MIFVTKSLPLPPSSLLPTVSCNKPSESGVLTVVVFITLSIILLYPLHNINFNFFLYFNHLGLEVQQSMVLRVVK